MASKSCWSNNTVYMEIVLLRRPPILFRVSITEITLFFSCSAKLRSINASTYSSSTFNFCLFTSISPLWHLDKRSKAVLWQVMTSLRAPCNLRSIRSSVSITTCFSSRFKILLCTRMLLVISASTATLDRLCICFNSFSVKPSTLADNLQRVITAWRSICPIKVASSEISARKGECWSKSHLDNPTESSSLNRFVLLASKAHRLVSPVVSQFILINRVFEKS